MRVHIIATTWIGFWAGALVGALALIVLGVRSDGCALRLPTVTMGAQQTGDM